MLKKYLYLEFFDPYFPTFGLNAEIYRVNFFIQSKLEKKQTRKTPNFDILHIVIDVTQTAYTSSKLTIETLEQGVKYG